MTCEGEGCMHAPPSGERRNCTAVGSIPAWLVPVTHGGVKNVMKCQESSRAGRFGLARHPSALRPTGPAAPPHRLFFFTPPTLTGFFTA